MSRIDIFRSPETLASDEAREYKPLEQREGTVLASDSGDGDRFPQFTSLNAVGGNGGFDGGPERPSGFKKGLLIFPVLPFALAREGIGKLGAWVAKVALRSALLSSKILPPSISIKIHMWLAPKYFAINDWSKGRSEFRRRIWNLITS